MDPIHFLELDRQESSLSSSMVKRDVSLSAELHLNPELVRSIESPNP
jgi:hypothetical protein